MKTTFRDDGRFLLGNVLAILCLLLLAFHGSNAAEKGSQGQFSSSDYKFVTEAAQGGNMEVLLGKLTVEKASDPAVRDFGTRMVKDHQKLNQELTQLVTQKGAVLPASSEKKDSEALKPFKSLDGAAFDKAYIKDMVSDHKKDVKAFQTAVEKADDADLKKWITQTLPTLQTHLNLAQDAEAKISPAK